MAEALDVRRRLLGPMHTDVAAVLHAMGSLRVRLRRFDEAMTDLEEAHAMRSKLLPGHRDTAATQAQLGVLYACTRPDSIGHTCIELALENQQRELGNEHPMLATTLCHKARLALVQQLPGFPHYQRRTCILTLRAQNAGQYAEALRSLKAALRIRRDVLGHDHPHVAIVWEMVAEALTGAGNATDARMALKKAEKIYAARLGPECGATKVVRRRIEESRAPQTALRQ